MLVEWIKIMMMMSSSFILQWVFFLLFIIITNIIINNNRIIKNKDKTKKKQLQDSLHSIIHISESQDHFLHFLTLLTKFGLFVHFCCFVDLLCSSFIYHFTKFFLQNSKQVKIVVYYLLSIPSTDLMGNTLQRCKNRITR